LSLIPLRRIYPEDHPASGMLNSMNCVEVSYNNALAERRMINRACTVTLQNQQGNSQNSAVLWDYYKQQRRALTIPRVRVKGAGDVKHRWAETTPDLLMNPHPKVCRGLSDLFRFCLTRRGRGWGVISPAPAPPLPLSPEGTPEPLILFVMLGRRFWKPKDVSLCVCKRL